jgi:hypothetical protein
MAERQRRRSGDAEARTNDHLDFRGGTGTGVSHEKTVLFEGIVSAVEKEKQLNEAQKRCYRLFVEKLGELIQRGTAWRDALENRCMYLGKSRVIEAIVTLFERAGCSEKPRVSATTGVAAQLVRGSTIDSLCELGGNKTV